ncbi:Fpg/Nei family DNA glycosylase [Microbacterium azadirachtae]|uniref:Fpg/Nei family DNA glycosylase n=1 Tax=Microbacterium azadirachtae TaxID=582680 RepID=UPI00088157A2|nr:DNA-formamidopyrimidine glycosylase family protein [Microbacterium azadirachtae]SDM28546.1 formamidopyrimidine-DNA glycosylase [Microbacterium azadirachtae]SEG48540.1 formamidopyrimidine-DNA glycosylase [Microbacterium azadirachtae]SEG51424.1 formamidopyrimidine-DNA glycosylase [Microbacterium azadirachtae]
MPESPEVQALVEFLDERIRGRAIAAVDIDEFRVVKTRERPPASLVGATIGGLARFGKHVGFDTTAGWLMLGFGRNGWIRWLDAGESPGDEPVPEVARIVLDDGAAMRIVDTGDFLGVTLSVVDVPRDLSGIAALGPDPLSEDFSREEFDRALGTRRKQIKALLQEQSSLAGIGNAYSDEILHRARIAPAVHAALLDDDERERLFQATVDVLRGAAADRRGVPPHELKQAKVAAMAVHGRGGEPCPVCGTTILDRTFGGASAQFCPHCQPEHSAA